MQGRRVVVTGAGGFIGSHLCERLVAEGASVRALCRYTSRRDLGNLALVPKKVRSEIEIEFGDLLDRDFVGRLVAGADTVFHLGASISVAYSYVAPREVVMTNVEGTLNVLTAALDAETEHVVQLSSSEVYGTAQREPIDEGHPLNPQSPYAASKVGADKLAEAFHLSFGLPVVIARPFNTFGPRQSRRAVIPTIVAQALRGAEIRLGALAPSRDFVYVADTVDALVRLARTEGGAGETFNIATGTDMSVGGIVETVAELLGRELRVVPDELRVRPEQSEVWRLIGTAAKLTQAVGWEPQTSLRTGLQREIEWMEQTPLDETSEYVI